MTTIHLCGFYDGDARRLRGMSVTACPDGETPHQAFERIRSNVEHFGGTTEGEWRTYPLGASRTEAVRVEWEAPARADDGCARMWHIVTTARPDEWRGFPAPEEAS